MKNTEVHTRSAPTWRERFWQYKWVLLALMLCQIGQVTASLLLLSFSADVIDTGIGSEDTSAILYYGGLMGGATLLQLILSATRYNPDQPLFEDVSLEAKPGQMLAIVGPTGAGKTTLVNLLIRFYEIDSGVIRLDDFVRTLPDGYDTVLENGGGSLSQGQRQLMTIARAFLLDAPILILDEATSSVDTRTEMLIQKAMTKLRQGRTSFVIAHRLSTIRDADVIVYMENGNVLETGTHDQLMELKGGYWQLQNGGQH